MPTYTSVINHNFRPAVVWVKDKKSTVCKGIAKRDYHAKAMFRLFEVNKITIHTFITNKKPVKTINQTAKEVSKLKEMQIMMIKYQNNTSNNHDHHNDKSDNNHKEKLKVIHES